MDNAGNPSTAHPVYIKPNVPGIAIKKPTPDAVPIARFIA